MGRVKFLIIVVTMFMLLTGCGKQEIAEPVECTEFTLPDNYCPAMIEEAEDANQVYMLGYNGDTYDYFVIQKSTDNFLENKLYKMSVKSFLKGAVDGKYQKESCDDYDTGKFKMQLRNKGDMSKKQGIYYEIFVRSFADYDGDFNGIEADFQNLIEQAHKRDIKVIMDFVINHTSSEHPWFQSAIADVSSPYRNYYRWVNKRDTQQYWNASGTNR